MAKRITQTTLILDEDGLNFLREALSAKRTGKLELAICAGTIRRPIKWTETRQDSVDNNGKRAYSQAT